MKIDSLKLVYFSPTGTTKKIVEKISESINCSSVEIIDLTRPDKRKRKLCTSPDDMIIIGVPVYMGRVPALLEEWFTLLEAKNTPAVCVVVYGNRAYENSLLELKDIIKSRGCISIAGAAFIGEHSFSDHDYPTAAGRPDIKDLETAELFASVINKTITEISSTIELCEISLPGSYPYGGVTKLWDIDFIEVSSECNQCGICADICPAEAINQENSSLIDIIKCISCCACIKNCPRNARSIKPGLVKDASIRLNKLYSVRKEVEIFIY